MNTFKNLKIAMGSQKSPFQWFKDGAAGIIKCITHTQSYPDEQIKSNRDTCRKCEFATKDENGKITLKSQCMAIDPTTGEVCGCFIVCKTQNDKCPLNKWVDLTISK
jgi:hypothetical protein